MSALPTNELAQELIREAPRLERAERILGHAFRDRALLLRALTHRTFANEATTAVDHNEVLELLGDAVLSLVTVEALLRSPSADEEGALTERRAAHVSEPALARAADAAALAELLRAGGSIARAVPVSTKADLVEALLGAVHLDGGLEAARACTERLLGPPPARAGAPDDNPKRTLQERLQRLLHEVPTYEVERVGPNHAPTFHARAVLRGRAVGEGAGPSKQAATEAAARAGLAALPEDDGALRALFEPSPP